MKPRKQTNSLEALIKLYGDTHKDSKIELRKEGRDAFLKLDLGEGVKEWKFQHPGPFKAYAWLSHVENGLQELFIDEVFNNKLVKVWIPLGTDSELNAEFFEKHASKTGELSLLAWWLNLSGSLLLYTTYETAGVVGLSKEGSSNGVPSTNT